MSLHLLLRGGAAHDTAPPQDVYPLYLCTADTLSNVRPSLFTFSIIRWCLPPTRSSIPTCSPAASSRSRMFSTHCRALACGPKLVEVLAYTLRPAYGPWRTSQHQRRYSPFELSRDSMSDSLATYGPGARGS